MRFRDRLAAFAERPAECWEWTGHLTNKGYGMTSDGTGQRRKRLCHRMAYEILVGPIPEGLTLDHLCRNRRCFNPAHLEAVTHRENMRRGVNAHVIRTGQCIRGHALTPENTAERKDGKAECRTCVRAHDRRRVGTRVRRMGKWYKPGEQLPPDGRGKWPRHGRSSLARISARNS